MGEDFYRGIIDSMRDGVYFVDQDRVIRFWSKGAESITGFSSEEVLGRTCAHNFLRHIDPSGMSMCDSLCPLTRTLQDGEPRESDIFLHHKEGHRVPVHVTVSPIVGEDGKVSGAVEVFSDRSVCAMDMDMIGELSKLALLDPLTGLGNRRFADMTLESKLDELKRYGVSFGVLFIDVDKFKNVNDSFGHDTGDEVLKMLARTLGSNLRSHDHLCRWGGEEFLAIVSHVSRPAHLDVTAKKLVTLMRASSVSSGERVINVTISAGATLARPEDTAESLIKRADLLMFERKKQGGDGVASDGAE